MNKETYNLDPMQAVIADAYRVFGRHRAPTHQLNACTLCCMTEELEQEMRQLPLAKLTSKHFYEYNTAAKGPEQLADEVQYLLPRMLELMAEGEEVHHSIELALQRLGHCANGSFSKAEMDVLNRFALAYFHQTLTGGRTSGVRRLLEEPLSVLLMFHIGGVATEPLLNLWVAMDEPESTIQFVEATYWRFWENQDYDNPFATDQPAFKELLQRWISNPEHRHRFAEKLMTPDFQRLAEAQQRRGAVEFSSMVEAAFDQLTQ